MNQKFLLLLNFLPIIIIFLLASYTTSFAIISNSILGKLFALVLIFFYIKHDKMIGLFVCLLVIFYYQTDFIHSLDWLNKPIPPALSRSSLSPKVVEEPAIYENMETVTDSGLGLTMESKKAEFRKTYCKKGHLLHKGQPIKNENAEHIFPQVKHADEYHKCNLCDNSCDFTIVDKKLDLEELLLKPKDSNDWVEYVWESMMNLHK